MLLRDRERALWQGWCKQHEAGDLLPRPLIEPLRMLYRARGHAAIRRRRDTIVKVASDGCWAQSKLFEAGLADTMVCQLCEVQEGTLHHRYFGCHCTAACRRELEARKWQTVAARQPCRRLWTMGLEASPEGQWQLQPVREQQAWSVAPGYQPVFEGSPCSDGSK